MCRWRGASKRTKRLRIWKNCWCIAGQAIDLNPTKDAITFVNEDAREVRFSPEHEIAEDV
jgi:hypothetical protein